MAARPCKECGKRPKEPGRHRCLTCRLRHEPIGEQVAAARRRLAMVPPELRRARGKKIMALAPAGTAWCAGCQSFRDDEDFGKKATTCRACLSARTHGAMIEKTYGLTGADYDALLAAQGGRCAICRQKPGKKRLAVDHDHKTGAVRGLICARDNHELLGGAWDSLAKIEAAWHYLNTPPASGLWVAPERAPALVPDGGAVRPSKGSGSRAALVVTHSGKAAPGVRKPPKRANSAPAEDCEALHYRPAGSVSDPSGPGYWRVYVEAGAEGEPPF